jgi:hypothetical protein
MMGKGFKNLDTTEVTAEEVVVTEDKKSSKK